MACKTRKANLIWSHDRANPSQLQNEKAVWSESIPKASMGSFSQMPVPFAALTVLEYDEKGLGRVQWLSYVYEKRTSGGERRRAEDGEMKWPSPMFVWEFVCDVNWIVNTRLSSSVYLSIPATTCIRMREAGRPGCAVWGCTPSHKLYPLQKNPALFLSTQGVHFKLHF